MMVEEDFDDDAFQKFLLLTGYLLCAGFLGYAAILSVEIVWNCFAGRWEVPAFTLAWFGALAVFYIFWMKTKITPLETVPRPLALAAFAGSLGMRFEAEPVDAGSWLPTDLPLLSKDEVTPTNVLFARLSDTDVLCFDLRTCEWYQNGETEDSKQTVICFPIPIPGLADFTRNHQFGRLPLERIAVAYLPILRREQYLNVQARGGRLIVFRPDKLVRPGSYAKWIEVACGIRADLIAAGPVGGD